MHFVRFTLNVERYETNQVEIARRSEVSSVLNLVVKDLGFNHTSTSMLN